MKRMSEIKIKETLLNLLSDINAAEIKSHIYDDESLKSWLCSWHEAVKNELYDFYDKAIDDFIKAADKLNIADITLENAGILRATTFYV